MTNPVNKDGKFNIEINKFANKIVKTLGRDKSKNLVEMLQDAISEIKKSADDNKPKLGERFTDLFGRSYVVMGKDDLLGETRVILRRGFKQYIAKLSELYNKDGSKKYIKEDITENEVLLKF